MNVNHIFPLTAKIIRGEPRSLLIVVAIYLTVCALVKIADFLLKSSGKSETGWRIYENTAGLDW